MKNQINKASCKIAVKGPLLKGVMALLALALSAGCATEKSDLPVAGDSGGEVPVECQLNCEGGNPYATGATVPLENVTNLAAYVLTHPVNDPQNLRLTVKAAHHGSGQYGGEVLIQYEDNGQTYTGRFVTENTTVTTASHGHKGKNYAAYNKWFSINGQTAFHGFFEDAYGAIMIIVDGAIDQGDGAGASELNGEVWFKNYQVSQAPYSGLPCWFVELGPYDCRTFLTDKETVTTSSALYPNQSVYTTGYYPSYKQTDKARGWKKLGRFTGLSAYDAGL